ncbi:MAG: thiamine pyrophosphate-dependent enzyme [Rhabdochlamydiaceae bacterium]|nr:thiamine pyrophosphate-dependent enzyme [Candidatus Amphrikana amoebophyrae]
METKVNLDPIGIIKRCTKKSHELTTYESMLLCRFVDDKMTKVIRQNKGGSFHLCANGHELIGTLSALALTPGKDWGLPYYRDRAFALGLGALSKHLFATLMGRQLPHHSGGRQMPEHFSHKALRIPCQSSVVGSQYLQAVGVALGAKLRGTDEVVYVSSGDGSTSQGDFHEALNFASIHKLAVVFVIQNNGWAISVPAHEQTAGANPAKLIGGFPGVTVFDVDGCDYMETKSALDSAVSKARKGEGPSVVVARIPRLGAHSSSDDPKKYRSEEEIAKEHELDPLLRFEDQLIAGGLISKEESIAIRERIFNEVEQAAKLAENYPHPAADTVMDHVYKDYEVKSDESEGSGEAIVMVDAINHALDEEMTRDKGMIVFGQDVAHGKGGVFGATRNLTEKHGNTRCFNSPLAESTIIGVALGLSMDGIHKPVVEIQFADYLWTGINQLFNEVSSINYRSNGEWNAPMTVRMPIGGYIQGGPYHSQSIEGFLAHCPGLKIAYPSNAADAKRLLKAAINDPNPTLMLEHKGLYRQRAFSANKEPDENSMLEFGKAKVVHKGDELTVVSWGMPLVFSYEIATQLAKEGISIEVIDLRTIAPYDFDAILESIKKTGKLLVVHEAAKTCGFGSEIAARCAEEGFEFLDAPVKRVTGLDCPIAFAKGLEDENLPQKKDIEVAMRDLVSF